MHLLATTIWGGLPVCQCTGHPPARIETLAPLSRNPGRHAGQRSSVRGPLVSGVI
jgi:hypothetical protein